MTYKCNLSNFFLIDINIIFHIIISINAIKPIKITIIYNF